MIQFANKLDETRVSETLAAFNLRATATLTGQGGR